jgi:hypothetical protein
VQRLKALHSLPLTPLRCVRGSDAIVAMILHCLVNFWVLAMVRPHGLW